MNAINHRPETLTVADVMSDKVVTVSPVDTLSAAADQQAATALLFIDRWIDAR